MGVKVKSNKYSATNERYGGESIVKSNKYSAKTEGYGNMQFLVLWVYTCSFRLICTFKG